MTTQTVLPGQDKTAQGDLDMSFELGDKQWQLTLSDERRSPSRVREVRAERYA